MKSYKPLKNELIWFISSLVLLMTACGEDDDPGLLPPQAVLETMVASPNTAISIKDQSSGAIEEWFWEFEGGSPSTSTDKNPEVTFNSTGEFSVKLTVSNSGGQSTTQSTILVTNDSFFKDVMFSKVSRSDEFPYGNFPDNQRMIIYEPEGDLRTDRPVVTLFGGGAFNGSNLDYLDPVARMLASHGVVVALCKYYKGNPADPRIPFILGQQDSKAAIRYLRSKASDLRISEDIIFNGGYATGGIIAVSHGFITEDEIPDADVALVEELGGWEGCPAGNCGFSSSAIGTIILSGGAYAPNLDLIDCGDQNPLFAVHGTADSDIPMDSISLDESLYLYGGRPLTNKVANVGRISNFIAISGGNHQSPRYAENVPSYENQLIDFMIDVEAWYYDGDKICWIR